MFNDPEQWQRIAAYLDQALELEPQARATWLAELEKSEAGLAATVRELLTECDALNSRGFMLGASPVTVGELMPALKDALWHDMGGASGLPPGAAESADTDPSAAALAANTIIGPYRLLRELGHGGMSSVWLAERCDGQLARHVALKLPVVGPPRAQLAERFKRERDILAILAHPNIARLYDAGISASGQAYLAMEYVDGIPLTRYCDAMQLPIRERLMLFQQVLAAVGFAHWHLILHRDLKPSNILVTRQGRLVLLDFGIAKLISQQDSPDTPATQMQGRMLTPDYASPEQITGTQLGTTSDVYSLGVLLFEMLAGGRPFEAAPESRRLLEEMILTREPQRPSQFAATDVIAQARQTSPRKLAKTLRGDLDAIILKALKKSPDERYHSIEVFARDIDNYLRNLPVSARPDSTWYRCRRFVTRYRWQVSAAMLALLAILIGGGAAAWQAQVAARQRDRAVAISFRNESINEFMRMLVAEAAASGKPVTVQEMLARSEALAATGIGGSVEVRAAILGTLAELYVEAGNAGRAAELYARARVLAAESSDASLRSRLACNHALIIADMGQVEPALSQIHAEIAKLAADPLSAAVCWANLSQISTRTGDADGVLRYALTALENYRSSDWHAPESEAELFGMVGYGYRLQGDNRAADRHYQLALQKFGEAGRERGTSAAVTLNNWALVSASAGVPRRSLELYEQTLGILTQRDPQAPLPPSLVYNRSRALEAIGRLAQAKDGYQSALQLAVLSKSLVFEVHCLLGLASIAEQSADPTAATAYLDRVAKLFDGPASQYVPLRAKHSILQGRLDLAASRLVQARASFDWAFSANSKNASAAEAAIGKALVDLAAGDAPAAVANARVALDITTSLQGGFPYSNNTGHAWLTLGRALQANGDGGAAREAFEAAALHLAQTVDPDHPALVQARQLMSM